MDTEFTKLPIYSYDYNKIENFCLAQRESLIQEDVGLILGVLRGGGVPALMLSQMLSIPVDFLYYNREHSIVEIKNQEVFQKIKECITTNKKILLVEDIAGVGYTLLNCYNYLLSLVKEKSLIKTFTLVYHGNSRMKPHYYKDFSNLRSVLPWEKYITSQLCFDDFIQTGEALLKDQIYKKIVSISDNKSLALSINSSIKIDYKLYYNENLDSILNEIRTIGPEEIYCNNDELISTILDKFPFIIIYKTINQKRYRIDSVDE
jgi:hypoxanthine phosphoribosyltransferase